VWAQMGYTPDDAEEFIAECHELKDMLPPSLRERTDLDLVVARSLSRWKVTPHLPSFMMDDIDDEAPRIEDLDDINAHKGNFRGTQDYDEMEEEEEDKREGRGGYDEDDRSNDADSEFGEDNPRRRSSSMDF